MLRFSKRCYSFQIPSYPLFLGLEKKYINPDTVKDPLYRSLLTATFSEDKNVLTLGDCGDHGKTQLFIRDDWRFLVNRMSDSFLHKDLFQNKKVFVVTGSPGIGKSHLKLFVMHQWVLTGRSFVYEISDRLFSFHSVDKEVCNYGTIDLLNLKLDDCAYFVDKPEKYTANHAVLPKCFATFNFCSPDKSRFHESIKLPFAAKFIMNPPSNEEINFAHANLDCFKVIPNDEYQTRLSICGPIFRSLEIPSAKLKSDFHDYLNLKGKYIVDSENWESHPPELNPSEEPSRLILMYRKPFTCEDPEGRQKDSARLEYASEFVLGHLKDLSQRRRTNHKSLLEDSPSFKSHLGRLLEQRISSSTNLQVSLTRLASGKRHYGKTTCSPDHSIKNIPKHFHITRVVKVVFPPRSIDPDVMYVPSNSNNPSWDGFLISSAENCLYFFQLTLASQHPVNGDSLSEDLKTIQKIHPIINNCELVFLSEDSGSSDCLQDKIQALRSNNKNYTSLRKIPKNIRHLTSRQWKCLVPSDSKPVDNE